MASKTKSENVVFKTRVKNHCQKAIGGPSAFDIICGRGRGLAKHAGNRRFHVIVGLHRNRYQRATKADKSTIVLEVIDAIHAGGARFLIKNQATNSYEEAGKDCVHKKVAHAFRDGHAQSTSQTKKKRTKTKSNRNDVESGKDGSLLHGNPGMEQFYNVSQHSHDSSTITSLDNQMPPNQNECLTLGGEPRVPSNIEFFDKDVPSITEEDQNFLKKSETLHSQQQAIFNQEIGLLNFQTKCKALHSQQLTIFNALIAKEHLSMSTNISVGPSLLKNERADGSSTLNDTQLSSN